MRLRSQALDLAESMGMTPRSRARLGIDVGRAAEAFDLARHWQEDGRWLRVYSSSPMTSSAASRSRKERIRAILPSRTS
jgi:hypothetical protein